MKGDSVLSTAPQFYDAGEAALVVEFGDIVDPMINGRVLALDAGLLRLELPGVRELVPTYRSLLVHYDPLLLSKQILCDAVMGIVAALEDHEQPVSGRRWVLPCCYEQSFAEDLDEVASLTGLRRDDVIALHADAQYRLYMYGFAPAYCYLGGLAEVLRIPRRQSPRPPHAAGAILIGGGLASIASFPMPTGWYVVGRTPVKLFAPKLADPFFLRPGDIIQFQPITPDEFSEVAARIAAGDSVALEPVPAEDVP